MAIEVGGGKPHVVVIPWPAQGHINPSLAFAKCLASKGLRVTLVTTTSVVNSAKLSDYCSSLTIAGISDGSEQVKETEALEVQWKRFRDVFSRSLATFMDDEHNCARAIIYDSTMPWVLDIAQERDLLGAPFFTESCAAAAVFYHMKQGLVRFPYEETVSLQLPALPAFGNKHLPSFTIFADTDDQLHLLKLVTDQFLNLEKADWIFLNTFHKLELEIIEWMRNRWPKIKTVGPTFLLDHNNQNNRISLFEIDACREWLDSRKTGSVVYVSFGSVASLGKEQMEEIAHGLIMSNCYFLWVVRSSEFDKLPQKFNSEKGLIVGWCHQPEVLAHRALACFMSHCGWNSTLEALSYGVPLIAMAQHFDQNMNAKFVEDVWRVGVGVEGGENGIVGRGEIAMRVKQVVGREEGIELKRNACRWKELAGEAVQNGGTSTNNIDDFVSKLIFSDREKISPTSVLI